MHADLKGSLRAIENSWKSFENNGKPMDRKEVEYILKYGIEKGYKTTADFKGNEVDLVLSKHWWDNLAASFQYYHLRKNAFDFANDKSIVEMYNKKDLKLTAD